MKMEMEMEKHACRTDIHMEGQIFVCAITPCAASIMGVSATAYADIGVADILLCAADEMETYAHGLDGKTIIPVYSDEPKQAYICRKAAYDHADACLTLVPATAERLRLLHPKVLLAESGEEALRQVAAHGIDWPLAKQEMCKMKTAAQPMTILFVTHDFRVGGLEQVVIDIAVLAKTLGHRPIIGYAGVIDDITRIDVENAGIEHERLPEAFEARKNFLRERSVSIVNAHYATILAGECRELDIPYLQTIHNMYLWLDEAGIAQWRELDAMTAGYIAVSANAAMVADLRLGLSPEKMVIVPNGVTMIDRQLDSFPEQETALRSEFGIPPEGIVFVQVASLNSVKAHTITVEAFAKALKTRQDIYLVLLGKESDAACAEMIREKIEHYSLGNHVFMPGYRKDVHRFLNLARAMVAPSFVEGWSLAISEALQSGVHVIATDVGGACEQFRETDNILLPSYFTNVASLSASVFFAVLRDESVITEGALRLVEAILQIASRMARTAQEFKLPTVRLAEEAYASHLEIMKVLLTRESIKNVRKNSYITQKMNIETTGKIENMSTD